MDDAELLGALEDALFDKRAEPSRAELNAFLTDLVAAPVGTTPRRLRWTRRVAAGGLVVLVAGGGTAYAAGDGSRLPGPVRRAAVAMRLPVDSPAVARARGALADLEGALARGDRGEIERALAAVEAALRHLSDDELAAMGPRAVALSAQATGALQGLQTAAASSAERGSGDVADDDEPRSSSGTTSSGAVHDVADADDDVVEADDDADSHDPESSPSETPDAESDESGSVEFDADDSDPESTDADSGGSGSSESGSSDSDDSFDEESSGSSDDDRESD